MIFYGEDCKKFLVVFKGLYSSVSLVTGNMWEVLHSCENVNDKSDPQKAYMYDRDDCSVKVECPR